MRNDYLSILTEAVSDMAENGFDSTERVAYWQRRLKEAAEGYLTSEAEMEDMLRRSLRQVYARLVDNGQVVQRHPGISRFTLDKIRPHLRAELERRIMASADLIRLNRKEAIDKTLKRFSGWATSIPVGGTDVLKKREKKQKIRKSLSSLPFEQRRVLIDQGHKLTSSINEIVANDGGAIAGEWHSHWRQLGYNYREDHKERDMVVYAVRGCWALKGGLMTIGAGYIDDITRPAEEPFCRCFYKYIYALRGLPKDMLTKKGESELQRAKALVAAL